MIFQTFAEKMIVWVTGMETPPPAHDIHHRHHHLHHLLIAGLPAGHARAEVWPRCHHCQPRWAGWN